MPFLLLTGICCRKLSSILLHSYAKSCRKINDKKAEDILTNKDQLILVYCRSGRRNKLAANSLTTMGYTNVKEFGGIIDWPYDIVTK